VLQQGLPRILLDARSFAAVPLSDRSTSGYFAKGVKLPEVAD